MYRVDKEYHTLYRYELKKKQTINDQVKDDEDDDLVEVV
jgi:hypothetical protein